MNLENHISQIISEYRFKIRSVSYPEACICYKQGIPCHKMDNLNCFLCYCPFYNRKIQEGGCLRNSPDGKWHYSDKLPKGEIWDCSNCEYPHCEDVARQYLEKIFSAE